MTLHFSKEEFASRKSKVISSMKEQNINALLMFKQESMYWLTGYDTFGFVFFQSLILRRWRSNFINKSSRFKTSSKHIKYKKYNYLERYRRIQPIRHVKKHIN